MRSTSYLTSLEKLLTTLKQFTGLYQRVCMSKFKNAVTQVQYVIRSSACIFNFDWKLAVCQIHLFSAVYYKTKLLIHYWFVLISVHEEGNFVTALKYVLSVLNASVSLTADMKLFRNLELVLLWHVTLWSLSLSFNILEILGPIFRFI